MFQFQRRDLAALSLVACSFLLIGYYYFVGLYCSDDTRYLLGAIKIAMGEPISTASLAERRVMFLLPAAMAYAPGRDLELMLVPYALLFVVLGLIGFALARRLLPPWAAVVGSVLAATQPVLFLYAGSMLPDVPATVFLLLALLMTCLWCQAMADPPMRGRARGFAFAIGASLAASFTIKESGLVFLPIPVGVMLLLALRERRIDVWSDLLAIAVGFLAALAVEACVFRLTAGEWFSSAASLLAPPDNFEGYLDQQGRTPLARLKTLSYALGPYAEALFAFAGVAALQLIVEWRAGRLSRAQALTWLAIAGFWLWPLVYFTFGTASLTRYMPPVIQQRYYAPCIIPAALLVAHLLVVIVRAIRARSPWAIAAVPACLVVLWLFGAPYATRKDRGLVYGSGAKESFELAREDAQRRFPRVPVYDVESGWTSDLNRCRALLMPDLPGGRDRLQAALLSGDDAKGQFGYPSLDALSPPYLLLGHGAYMEAQTPSAFLKQLKAKKDSGMLTITRVGRYTLAPAGGLRGRAWLPRTFAVREVNPSYPQLVAPESADPADINLSDLYLVEAGRGASP